VRHAAHPRGFRCWSSEPRLRPHAPRVEPTSSTAPDVDPVVVVLTCQKKRGAEGASAAGATPPILRAPGAGPASAAFSCARHAQAWRAPSAPDVNPVAAGLSKGSRRGLSWGRHVQVGELPDPGCVPAWRALPLGHGGRWHIGGVARRGRRKERWRRRGMRGEDKVGRKRMTRGPHASMCGCWDLKDEKYKVCWITH
jgi:hypothetical protein